MRSECPWSLRPCTDTAADPPLPRRLEFAVPSHRTVSYSLSIVLSMPVLLALLLSILEPASGLMITDGVGALA